MDLKEAYDYQKQVVQNMQEQKEGIKKVDKVVEKKNIAVQTDVFESEPSEHNISVQVEEVKT